MKNYFKRKVTKKDDKLNKQFVDAVVKGAEAPRMESHKVVLVIQDLLTKDNKSVAVVSCDVHYHKSIKDKVSYDSLVRQIAEEKDADKKNLLQDELLKLKNVASVMFTLDQNKDFKRHVSSIVMEAISLKEKENGKKETGQ